MVTIKKIRNAIVRGLYDYLKLIPIPVEDIKPKEPYPYITYNFISPYTQFSGMGNYSEEFVKSDDDRFKYDVLESLELQPQTTISINFYSKDKAEALDLAHKAMGWFKHSGWQFLSDSNLTVVDLLAFGDRTALIVDEYEARIGFDVVIRFTDILEHRFETIEEANVTKIIE